LDYTLFSESQSRVIVSVSPSDKDEFEKIISEHSTPVTLIGKTTEKDFKINDEIEISLEKLIDIYYNTISKKMNVTV
jgi:phosphoribosylformylglycinamidine synthase